MRIADKMALQQVQSSLTKNRSETYNLQEQSSTQRRINKPSDDPLSLTRVMGAKTDIRNQKQFINSLNLAKDFLTITDDSLSEIGEILNRAKELALGQSNQASSNPVSRQVVANEVEQLLNQTVQISNRRLGDRYLFGGYVTNRAPFESNGNYQGDHGEIRIQIDKDAFVTMNLPGHKVFLGQGAIDGSIDDKGIPRTTDQLLELKEELQSQEEQEASETHLDQVYSKTPKSPKSIVQVKDSESSPDDTARLIPQGANVFDVLQQLVISLRTDSQDGIQESLDQLDLAFDQVVNARAQVGARVMSLNGALEGLQKALVDSKSTASKLEDADIFQLVSDINRADAAMKATLETSGRLIQPSLLDFLK